MSALLEQNLRQLAFIDPELAERMPARVQVSSTAGRASVSVA